MGGILVSIIIKKSEFDSALNLNNLFQFAYFKK